MFQVTKSGLYKERETRDQKGEKAYHLTLALRTYKDRLGLSK